MGGEGGFVYGIGGSGDGEVGGVGFCDGDCSGGTGSCIGISVNLRSSS